MSDFKIPSDSPRIVRSEYTDTVIAYNGEMFDDGLFRLVVPASKFTQSDCDEITVLIVAREEVESRLQSKIAMINRLINGENRANENQTVGVEKLQIHNTHN